MFHPFGNTTTAPPAAWHPEPNFRGTFTVLSTSLFTMSLCIWTAVHLNLPEHRKEHLQKWRKLRWLVMGLLAPEVVAWNAWEQRRLVKALTTRMHELHERRLHLPARKPRTWIDRFRSSWQQIQPFARWERAWHQLKVILLFEPSELEEFNVKEDAEYLEINDALSTWTDLHSWYALMGGYAFDTSSAERPFLPGGCQRVVLTLKGIELLAERWPYLLPKLLCSDIADKSKSDGLAKLITCWQATWFCVQCIFRLSRGLEISLLELNVFGHAVCALVIYLIWWDKPQDINEPTRIGQKESFSVAAIFSTLSPLGAAQTRPSELSDDGNYRALKIPRQRHLHWVPLTSEAEGRLFPKGLLQGVYPVHEVNGFSGCLWVGDRSWMLVDFGGGHREYSRRYAVIVDRYTVVRLNTSRLDDWMRIQEFWKPSTDREILLVRFRSTNWSLGAAKFKEFSRPVSLLSLSGITLATILYGGLHATAWNASYPSYLEQNLWRISCLTVVLTGPGLILAYVTLTLVFAADNLVLLPSRRRSERSWEWPKRHKILARALDVLISVMVLLLIFLIALALVALGPWYVFARVFLVVESFINVSHLSKAMLSVPQWSGYVPHVT